MVVVLAQQFSEIWELVFQPKIFAFIEEFIVCCNLVQSEVIQLFQAVASSFWIDITIQYGFTAYDEGIFVEHAVLGELLPSEVAVVSDTLFVGFGRYWHSCSFVI